MSTNAKKTLWVHIKDQREPEVIRGWYFMENDNGTLCVYTPEEDFIYGPDEWLGYSASLKALGKHPQYLDDGTKDEEFGKPTPLDVSDREVPKVTVRTGTQVDLAGFLVRALGAKSKTAAKVAIAAGEVVIGTIDGEPVLEMAEKLAAAALDNLVVSYDGRAVQVILDDYSGVNDSRTPAAFKGD